jgi:hypothetical protein
MVAFTPEQRQIIEKSGDEPVRIEDPETHSTYVIIKAEVYERLRPSAQNHLGVVPEGIRRSQDAFFRDLPKLLEDKDHWGQWAAYHCDELIGTSHSRDELIREVNRRGIGAEDFDLFVIAPQSRDVEEVTFPSSWL